MDLIRKYDGVSVAGNHDLAAIGRLSIEAFNPAAAAANTWTTSQLSDEHKEYLGGLPLRAESEGFTVVHGSPRDPVWEYVVSAQAAVASFLHFDTPWCLVGHSHIPFICRPSEEGAAFLEFPLDKPIKLGDERLIINPGGVGQPRDGDPRASFAVFDSSAQTITHLRAAYDVAKTQEKITGRGLPKYLADRLEYGR
ncbi:MAG: metallophosphoesterase [SAR202 cluster bacterium]|nr:metallophosphoesterase [SAR202 cluster bacterium]